MRRVQAVVMLVGALLIVAAGLVTLVAGQQVTAAEELGRRLRRTTEPVRFGFEHRAGAMSMLDCVLPNRRFTGSVDRAAEVLEVRKPGEGAGPIAVVVRGRALLHRSLFRRGSLPAPWLGVAGEIDPEADAALRLALGADLAGYVLADGLPASGRQLALEALEATASVDRIGTVMRGTSSSDGFRVGLDNERLPPLPSTAAKGDAGSGTSSELAAAPVLDVWVDARDEVSRVEVRQPGADDLGWIVDYIVPGPRVDASEPATVADVQAVDPARLVGAAGDTCEVAG